MEKKLKVIPFHERKRRIVSSKKLDESVIRLSFAVLPVFCDLCLKPLWLRRCYLMPLYYQLKYKRLKHPHCRMCHDKKIKDEGQCSVCSRFLK
jgi:hypothetical protein